MYLFLLSLWFPIFCTFLILQLFIFKIGVHFYINCDFLLLCGGCVWSSCQILLSLFFSWHSALVLCFALRFIWLVLFMNQLSSLLYLLLVLIYLFIYLFIYLPLTYVTVFNLFNLWLWYCGSLSISWAWSSWVPALRSGSWDTREFLSTVNINGWQSL